MHLVKSIQCGKGTWNFCISVHQEKQIVFQIHCDNTCSFYWSSDNTQESFGVHFTIDSKSATVQVWTEMTSFSHFGNDDALCTQFSEAILCQINSGLKHCSVIKHTRKMPKHFKLLVCTPRSIMPAITSFSNFSIFDPIALLQLLEWLFCSFFLEVSQKIQTNPLLYWLSNKRTHKKESTTKALNNYRSDVNLLASRIQEVSRKF